MRKFTQRELLEEGFWDRFKGVVRAGAGLARKVAPEITDPLDQLQNTITGVRNDYKQGKAGVPDSKVDRPLTTSEVQQQRINSKDETVKVDKTTMLNIKMGLEKHNLSMLPNSGVYLGGLNPENGTKLFRVKVQDRQGEQHWVMVDTRGLIFNSNIGGGDRREYQGKEDFKAGSTR